MMKKYPRTPHLEGSRLQAGDFDIAQVAFREIKGKHLVIEEKVDGANCGISFDSNGQLLLQSRGHYLQGGPRERQFAMLKQWTSQIQSELFERLGDQYVMYGEWLFAKHTIFYDQLPHYFLEFDILDRSNGSFLSTRRREQMTVGLPIASVPVLHRGMVRERSEITALIGPSVFIGTDFKDNLARVAMSSSQSFDDIRSETDLSGMMEGLYIKVENDSHVLDRLKFVRADFHAVVDQSGSHWIDRPMLKNQLA